MRNICWIQVEIFCLLVGEDGPSQMALEDFACFRTVPRAVCFYPSDAVSCERAIELAANYRGITFTRTSRPETPVIYKKDEVFEIGKGKVSSMCVHTHEVIVT